MDQVVSRDIRNTFGVVACADERMLAAACCALLSVNNHLQTVKAKLFLLAIDVDEDQIAAVADFARHHSISIELLRDTSPEAQGASLGRWSRATLSRLYLDLNIPPTIDRLLYIDADAIAVSGLDPLFKADLRGKPLGAVDDYLMPFREKMERRQSRIGMRRGARYFNAGVLLFDWQTCLAQGLVKDARDRFEASPDLYDAHDQDVLNLAFEDNWVALEPRWNAQTGILPLIEIAGIRHFTGRKKPWQATVPWPHRQMKAAYSLMLDGTRWVSFCQRSSMPAQIGSFLSDRFVRLTTRAKAAKVRHYFNAASYNTAQRGIFARPDDTEAIRRSNSAAALPERSQANAPSRPTI